MTKYFNCCVLLLAFLGRPSFALDQKNECSVPQLIDGIRGAIHLVAPDPTITQESLESLIKEPIGVWQQAKMWAGIATFVGPLSGLTYFMTRNPQKKANDSLEVWFDFFKGLGAAVLLLPTVPVTAVTLAPPSAGIAAICALVENKRREAPHNEAQLLITGYFGFLRKIITRSQEQFATASMENRIAALKEYRDSWAGFAPLFQKLPVVKVDEVIAYGSSEEEQLRREIMQRILDSNTFRYLTTEDLNAYLSLFDDSENVLNREAALLAITFAKEVLDQYENKPGHQTIYAVIRNIVKND